MKELEKINDRSLEIIAEMQQIINDLNRDIGGGCLFCSDLNCNNKCLEEPQSDVQVKCGDRI